MPDRLDGATVFEVAEVLIASLDCRDRLTQLSVILGWLGMPSIELSRFENTFFFFHVGRPVGLAVLARCFACRLT